MNIVQDTWYKGPHYHNAFSSCVDQTKIKVPTPTPNQNIKDLK